MTTSLSPSPVSELLGFAAGQGHPDHPCLSRTHAPASCVPCADFSPWLRDRVARGDAQAVGEYLFRVREANPGLGESRERLRRRYGRLARALLGAPLEQHLAGGDEEAFLELRVALVLLAVHEGFSGFIMTGEAADFVAAIMAPPPGRCWPPTACPRSRHPATRCCATSSTPSWASRWAPGRTRPTPSAT